MKNLYLTTGTINEVFNELSSSYNGVLDSRNNEFKLALNSESVRGKIDGVTFINGITSFNINIEFSNDTTISIEPFSKSSILFAYCKEGTVKHSYGISGHATTLRKHYSQVLTSSRSINTILHFKKDTPVQFSLIKVETKETAYSNSSLISQLRKTFLNKKQDYSYQGLQNLDIAAKLSQMEAITEHGMKGHMVKKELLESILEQEIEDNTDNLVKLSRVIKRTTINQINELKKLPTFIKNYAVETLYNKVINSKNGVAIK